ncbi:MAG TPA: FHA domain-containing protein, partial [Thermoanaerobaculia bacterium]|nr:FHA domain-containing protein [Thermoanaerobaculia bacterium]
MSFLIQRVVGRGLTLGEVRGDVLRIGRGTQQELRSDNPAVALEHAVIEGGAGGYSITDRGSITGTYVNGKPVETHRLAKGDAIEIGDLKIEVQSADAGKPLFLRVSSTAIRMTAGAANREEEEDESRGAREAGGVLKAPKIDFVAAYRLKRPWLTKVSLMALLVLFALAIVGEVTRPEKRKAFMPGGISSAHARARDPKGLPITGNCHACHDPWRGITSAKCSECHGTATHAENVAGKQDCAGCHTEHRGAAKLALISDRTCVACHGQLATRMKQPNPRALAAYASITSFGEKHPEISWPADNDTLRFNHKLHLRAGGLFNGEGRRQELACTDCHKLVETKGKFDPAPVKFDVACRSCHKLTFDPRFPDAEVPHGADPGLVYGFILQTYAGNRDIAGKSAEEVRRLLGSRAVSTPDERAVLNAEQVIKIKCSLCHDINRVNGRLTATKPVIATQWLTHAKFSHGPHRNRPCDTCHDAKSSAKTSDVLMPARQTCAECHGRETGQVTASRNCTLCHDYHEQKNLMMRVAPAALADSGQPVRAGFGGGDGMLSTILLVAIILLLLIVLVPVSLALYQRMKPAPPERAPRAPQAPIPPMPPPGAKAAKVPAMAAASIAAPAVAPRASAPPAAAPAPPPTPAQVARAEAAEATQMARKDEAAEPVPGGTEMMQWFGMLHCTSGPLEGQRFIIED